MFQRHQPEALRTPSRPFFVYLDECHRYLSGDLENILAESRKYGIAAVLARFPQVELARAKIRQFFYAQKLIWAGPPKRRQIALGEQFESFFQLIFRQRVQHHQAFAFSFIGNRCYHEDLLRGVRQFV